MNKVEIVIENTGKRLKVAQGTSLAQLAEEHKDLCQNAILGALVNNKVTALNYHIYNPKCIRFFDITDSQGMRMYKYSLTFLLYKAVRDCYPQATLKMQHSLLSGYYCKVDLPEGNADDQLTIAQTVRERMIELQQANLPFESENMLLSDALEAIKDQNVPDTYRLIADLKQLYIIMQRLDGATHKISCTLVPSTGCLSCWDFRPFEEGFLLHCPDPNHPDKLSFFQETPKLFNVFQEHHHWAELLKVPTVPDLNAIIRNKGENHLIQVAEALHEKKYAHIAECINERRGQVKMVLLAGPSSSGKTTSCRRLGVQLSVLGFDVQQMSLDDYFVDRDRTPLQPNGEYDFEALEALDIEMLNDHLLRLFKGERVEIPTYDFIKGTHTFSGKALQLNPDSILIVEGIHALNPKLTAAIPEELKFKVYVSALTQIAIDNQNIIHSSDNRLIRRIVRDNNFRGYSALNTLKRWGSVRAGEMKHIFPYQENADIMFNSALLYELALLRTYAEPLLKQVPVSEPEYAEAQRLLSIIELIEPIDPKFIPPTSIMREFLGGSSFEY